MPHEAELNFFVGVDYPLISPEVVSYLADVTLKQFEGGAMGLSPAMLEPNFVNINHFGDFLKITQK
jgi:molybdopterin-guanine dinucleotide biosynthesis protein A